MKAYLTYGFWLPCGPDDLPPPGVDSRIWTESSPKRALEIALAAARPSTTISLSIVEAWHEYKLERVYVGWAYETYEGPEYLGPEGPTCQPFHRDLRALLDRFGGQEYGWHLFSTDQEGLE
jgi:hypothetical protein